MGVKVNKILEKFFMLEEKIDEFINYLENESYYIKLKSDVVECEDYLELRVEIPGIDKDDFKIYKKENNLVIKGIKKKEYNEENVKFILAERRFGIFSNVFSIPSEFDINSLDLKVNNGVLIIKIPRKKSPTIIKKIEIE